VASLLKRWILGTPHGSIRPQQLDYYLNESRSASIDAPCRLGASFSIGSSSKASKWPRCLTCRWSWARRCVTATDRGYESEMDTPFQELKEGEAASKGQPPGSSLTHSCGVSVQRASLLLQWRGDGSRDALSMSVPLGTAVNASPKFEARGISEGD